MVRRKIDIKPIEDKARRHTTFTKRRKGLMKKTEEFCIKSNSSAVLIVFSSAGNCYVLGHPDQESVLARFEAETSSSPSTALPPEEPGSSKGEEGAAAPLTEVEKRIAQGVKTGDWEEAARGLELEELEELYAKLHIIWRELDAHETKLRAAAEKEKEGESGPSGEGSSRNC